MNDNHIEFSNVDRLVYLVTGPAKTPMGFVDETDSGNLVLFTTFEDQYLVKVSCERAYIHEVPETIDQTDADMLASGLVKLYNIPSKRMCYFIKEYNDHFKLTKVENVSRNDNPKRMVCDWVIEKSNLPAPFGFAINGLRKSSMVPATSYGTYIPVPFAKLLVGFVGTVKKPQAKIEQVAEPNFANPTNIQEISYWMVGDNSTVGTNFYIEKYVGENLIDRIPVLFRNHYGNLEIRDEFESVKGVFLPSMDLVLQYGKHLLSTTNGEIIWRTHESSKIAPVSIKPSEPEAYIKIEPIEVSLKILI